MKCFWITICPNMKKLSWAYNILNVSIQFAQLTQTFQNLFNVKKYVWKLLLISRFRERVPIYFSETFWNILEVSKSFGEVMSFKVNLLNKIVFLAGNHVQNDVSIKHPNDRRNFPRLSERFGKSKEMEPWTMNVMPQKVRDVLTSIFFFYSFRDVCLQKKTCLPI